MTQDNTILCFSKLPRYAEIRPQDASPAVDAVLAHLSKAADDAANAAPEWETMWAPLEEAEESVSRAWNQIEHMHAVMSVPEWREAHKENLSKVAALYARLGQHEGVYANLLKLLNNANSLSPTRKKILQDARQSFELSGVGLETEHKNQFRQNEERLAALASQFEENLLDATNQNSLIAEESDLGDMPDDIKTAAKQKDGNHRFTLSQPSYVAFMQYSPTREKRQTMYYHYNTRASEYGPAERDNSSLINEITELRRKQAGLLGFESYANVALQTRMAQSPHEVVDFLRDLAAKAMPHAQRELEELREFAADELNINDLQPWDVPFVSDHLRRRRFEFSQAELRPYLQAQQVLDGLLTCIGGLFGVDFAPAEASTYESQKYLEAKNKDGTPVGGIYLDLFARETKRGGAWAADSLSRFRRRDKLQLPVAHVVCNFTPPAEGKTALLNWDEAQTLFHEFGHALHHLLTEVEDYSASGMNGVEWDAVELPSQFMENFIWDWRVLEPMTAHVKSGEPMPRALFERALAARRFQAGLHLLRQIEFALFDLSLHTAEPRPFMDALNEVRRETAVLPVPEWNRFPCGFSHIFAGGYAAGYYSYLWAEVLAADVFDMFKESGEICNPELGARFRREILGTGGSRPAAESFFAMRGREPQPEALLHDYGLSSD